MWENGYRFLFETQTFSQALGWLFAIAMAIGGILDDQWKKLATWVVAASIYAIMQETIRYYLLAEIGHSQNAAISVIITLSTAVVYIVGMTVGWAIVWFGRMRIRTNGT